MSDYPCSCGTCPLYSTGPHPIGPDDIHYCGKERISEYQRQCTSHKGCLSHPLAREYLNKEVIEELEKRVATTHPNDAFSNEMYHSQLGAVDAYEEAIKLLKEGVKK